MSLRESIIAARDRKVKAVPTPEWPEVDGKVFVRSLSAYERLLLNGELQKRIKDEAKDVNAYCAAFVLCDKDGNREFDPDNATDLELLNGKSGFVIERIITTFREFEQSLQNHMSTAEKNS